MSFANGLAKPNFQLCGLKLHQNISPNTKQVGFDDLWAASNWPVHINVKWA